MPKRFSAPTRGFDQIPVSLGSDARVQTRELTDLRDIIRQIGQLVQHDVGFEVMNRLDQCLPADSFEDDAIDDAANRAPLCEVGLKPIKK